MDASATDQMINELFTAFESSESQIAAIIQFMKDKGLATSEDLAPYLEQAGKASDVRSRAARLRFKNLLSSALKATEDSIVKEIERKSNPNGGEQKMKKDEGRDQKNTEESGKDCDRAGASGEIEQETGEKELRKKAVAERSAREANPNGKETVDSDRSQEGSLPDENSVPAKRSLEPGRKTA